MTETLVTAAAVEELRTEQARLEAERETLVGRLRHALELGSASPGRGEYLDAIHELDLLDRRIALVEARLAG